MAIPVPGQAVRGSKSGVPVMALFDLLGRPWAMGVIWQLQGGPYTFRQLQERCETISPAMLNSRIKDLREASLAERTLDGYQLTKWGEEIITLLTPFGEWSHRWAKEVFDFVYVQKERSKE